MPGGFAHRVYLPEVPTQPDRGRSAIAKFRHDLVPGSEYLADTDRVIIFGIVEGKVFFLDFLYRIQFRKTGLGEVLRRRRGWGRANVFSV